MSGFEIYDTLVTKQSELTGILSKLAAENRAPNDEEKRQLETLQNEVKAIRTGWESEGRKRFLEGITRTDEKPVILKADQKLSEVVKGTYPAEMDRLSISRILRGYVYGDWHGSELEMKAMASSPTSAGGIFIPAPLSARVIDLARAQSVVFRAGAVTVPMETATVKLPRVTTDPTAAFYSEAQAIAASDGVFDSVTFTARKLACLVVVNNELLEDAQGVDAAIENSIATAMALKLDYVALTGSGTPPEPRGVFNTSGINTVTSVGTPANFDKFMTAVFSIKADNFSPNAIAYSARTAETLAKLKTGISSDNTPLAQPADYAELAKYVSTQIPNNLGVGTNESFAIIGQWNQLAVGVRKTITIEMAREGAYDISGTVYSAFQKDQTLVRAILRADVQVMQPTAFCAMSGITA